MPEQVNLHLAQRFDAQSDAARREDMLPESGVYAGQEAHSAPDALSLLEDSLEELTFSIEDTEEKHVASREMGDESRVRRRMQALVQKLLETVPDMEHGEALEAFQRQLRQMEKTASARDILALVKQSYEDPSHQFAALSAMQELFGEDPETQALAERLGEALALLEEEAGPSAHAGLNIGAAAARGARQGLGDIGHLRELYRSRVLGFDNILQSYEAIVAEYGVRQFDETINFLLQAIGVDIEAQHPSTDPAALKQVHDDLFQVRLLGDIHRDMAALASRMQQQFGVRMLQDPEGLMQSMIGLLKQAFVSESHFLAVVNGCGLRAIAARIDFLREWNKAVRKLPLKVYEQQEQRTKLLGAGQLALDALVAEEEASW